VGHPQPLPGRGDKASPYPLPRRGDRFFKVEKKIVFEMFFAIEYCSERWLM